ncbi:alpha-L-arabinofuranosidase C-terminal domain-containing protein [Microlunatus soli]|uniref:non-reducing end alpha-L-arabinofuranosidase n=1 Tax=Microlunatus soli TaxID=630515 RepID=A0A1H1ZE48_9ACTN|nr:alpha-L-arabinofuranosidase C-terminal domain-containing protein [Microlunatus soli]SDT31486.1 alpha-N-arabinofuranosidase [Microlunatus soli]
MTTTIRVDPTAEGAAISPDIYGQYLEHVEDCVDPGLIDEHGLRSDVIELSRDLTVPAIRWPGGCFADVYHWTDGIGDHRPVRPNWHWGNGELESNRFGTHEFLDWCERVGATPYINTNLGTGSLTEALRWLDYCTGTADTDDVRLRRANGRDEPWDVRYWGIGNETWGSWEAGHSDAAQYGSTLANWSDFFHRYDPEAVIVGVGSSEARDPDWDRTVLDLAGDHLGLLSLHVYGATVIGEPGDRRAALAHFPAYVEQRIAAMGKLITEHNDRHRTSIGIALDEWNIRHWQRDGDGHRLQRADPRTGTDALCAAGFFHAMIRNADLVRMANYVFLVNGNGVIDARNGRAASTSLFTVFRAYQQWLTGACLPVQVEGVTVATPSMISGSPERTVDPGELPDRLPAVDAVASRDGDQIRLAVINRSDDPTRARVDLGAPISATEQWIVEPDTETLGTSAVTITGSELTLPPWSITFLGGR